MSELSSEEKTSKQSGITGIDAMQVGLSLIAQNLQKAFNEDAGTYKGYIVDPTVTVSHRLGSNTRVWRPSKEQIFKMVEGSTINTLIHRTRKEQMLRMTQYQEYEDALGWRIVHKDHKNSRFKEPDDAANKKEFIRGLFERPHKLGIVGNTYAQYLSMVTDAMLGVDLAPVSIIRTTANQPAGLAVYDPCTIEPVLEVVWKYYQRNQAKGVSDVAESINQVLEQESEQYRSRLGGTDLTKCSWVQYVNGELVAGWSEDEMIVGVNNPISRLEYRGNGISPAESSIIALDAWLKAWGYNVNMFTSGMNLIKGILAAVGSYTTETVQMVKEGLESQIRGPGLSGRVPIVGVPNEKGLQWIRFDPNNTEMEFMQWLDYCTSLVCGIYRINPQEINLASRSQAFSGSMMSHKQDYLITQTKEEGFHSLLIQTAQLNNRIIAAMGPEYEDYRFVYTGLEQQASEKEKAEILKNKEHYSLNEKRASDDHDPKSLVVELDGQKIDVYEHSENAVRMFLQLYQAKQQADAMKQQMQGEVEGGEEQETEKQKPIEKKERKKELEPVTRSEARKSQGVAEENQDIDKAIVVKIRKVNALTVRGK